VTGRVAPTKGNLAPIQGNESMVREGHSMRVTAEILQYMLGSSERTFRVDHPVLPVGPAHQGAKVFFLC
jgi:hypothetical protein